MNVLQLGQVSEGSADVQCHGGEALAVDLVLLRVHCAVRHQVATGKQISLEVTWKLRENTHAFFTYLIIHLFFM